MNKFQERFIMKNHFFAIIVSRLIGSLYKSENNNQIIQLTDVFCALFIYNWSSNIWL
jgi:hypothetical protein